MLYKKLNSHQYRADFTKKFINYSEKAPVLLSFVMTENLVRIIHETSQKMYDFSWDYEKDIKTFIWEIKSKISENHYPRLVESVYTEEKKTPEELADEYTKSGVVGSTIKVVKNDILWRVERVIVKQDNLILVNEDTGEQFLYKMNTPCTFFLTKYRSGFFKSLNEAWNYFNER